MIKRGAFLGSVFTFGLILLANAINWFITATSHPHAGSARAWLVGLQALAGVILAAWAYRRVSIESKQEVGAAK